MDKAARAALLTAKGMDKTSENIADYVADLLRQGRAKEITDDLMEQADPQRLMHHYKSGNTGMDLPMDKASRMARAAQMGLTEDSLHGTAAGKDFSRFKGADRYGSRLGQENYVAPNTTDGRKLAAQFSTSDQGRVMPLLTPKPLDTSTLDDRLQFEKMMEDKNRMNDFRMKGGYRVSGLPGWGDQWAIDTVNEAGVPAMKLHERDWVTSTAVFDPTKMRSQFARFDPRLDHLAHLNASTGGAMDFARHVEAVQRAGGQIAPSKYLPNVPRQVHAGGGKVAESHAFMQHLRQATEDMGHGFGFEEGGCLGMAHALAEEIGGNIAASKSGFNHYYAEKNGNLYDYTGQTSDKHGYEKSSIQEGMKRLGVTPQEHEADKASAKAVIEEAKSRSQGYAGGGKVAFMQGNHPDVPDVVYHGTGADIRSFDRSKIGQGQLGFHFGNKEAARSITDTRQSASTMPVHLSLKNPIRLQDHGHWDMSGIYGDLSKSKKFRQEDLDNFLDREQDGNVKNNELADFIQAHGYDGVVYTNRGEGLSGKDVDHMYENDMDSFLHEMSDEEFRKHFPSASDSFIVFHPTQIKSAIGNQGTFDPNDPDITKAGGGSVTDSDEFRNWFGNSVTHTDGDPHVFYTGTSKDKDFTSFNVGRHGAWFTRDPAEASQYAEQNDSQGYKHEAGWKLTPTNTAGRVIPAYVKAENPYTGDLPDEVLRSNYKAAQSDWFDTLRRKGHDAWVPARYNGDLVVALKEPQQIKSIFNNGKFDPNQKHMNKAGGGTVGKEEGGATGSLREKALWPSAQAIKAGTGSREAHEELVNKIKPVSPYAAPVAPASDQQVHDALTKDKQPKAFAPRALGEGTPVAVRLDIPAYEKRNTWVVSVHHPKSDFTAGEVIGYDSVAHIGNPRFGVHPTGALNIASGKPKATIATVHGNWKKTTPEDAFKLSQTVHNDPQWRQVGMDPERHSYFYDRETQEPVMAADEALHIGPLVYAKNPVYGKKTDFAFSSGGDVSAALALTRRFTKDGTGATMALKPKGK